MYSYSFAGVLYPFLSYRYSNVVIYFYGCQSIAPKPKKPAVNTCWQYFGLPVFVLFLIVNFYGAPMDFVQTHTACSATNC